MSPGGWKLLGLIVVMLLGASQLVRLLWKWEDE